MEHLQGAGGERKGGVQMERGDARSYCQEGLIDQSDCARTHEGQHDLSIAPTVPQAVVKTSEI